MQVEKDRQRREAAVQLRHQAERQWSNRIPDDLWEAWNCRGTVSSWVRTLQECKSAKDRQAVVDRVVDAFDLLWAQFEGVGPQGGRLAN